MSKLLFLILTNGLLLSCNVFSNNTSIPGITYVISRGSPIANWITWSPTDSTKILVSATGFLRNDSQVYILDVTTKKKTVLVGTDYSGVIGNGWSPNGNQITLSVNGAVKRFPQSGLWMMNVQDNSLELLFAKLSDVAWLPDGKTLALLALESVLKVML